MLSKFLDDRSRGLGLTRAAHGRQPCCVHPVVKKPPLSGLAAQHVRLLLTECGQHLPPLTIGQTPF